MLNVSKRKMISEKKNLVFKIFLKMLENFSDLPPEVAGPVIMNVICKHSFFSNYEEGTVVDAVVSQMIKSTNNGSSGENHLSPRRDSPKLPLAIAAVEEYLANGGSFSEDPKKLATRVKRGLNGNPTDISHELLVVASSRIIPAWKGRIKTSSRTAGGGCEVCENNRQTQA